MNERLFSDEELKEMEKRTLDRLNTAIEAGDTEKAKKIAKRMYNEFLGMHDLYRNWVTATLSEIGKRYGDDELEDIMKVGVEAWWIPVLDKLPKESDALAHKIKMFVSGLHGHLQPLEIEEDEEKITVKLCPCGSGGRLISEGHYDRPDGFLTIEKGQRLTFGRDNFPVYCAHESAMERINIEHSGTPFVVVEPAAKLGKEYCTFHIYKDPDKIPKKYYERLGLSKPKSTAGNG